MAESLLAGLVFTCLMLVGRNFVYGIYNLKPQFLFFKNLGFFPPCLRLESWFRDKI